MKTRPLCFTCLCFFIAHIFCFIITGGNLSGEIPVSSIFYGEKEKNVVIHGQVYQKSNTSKIQILYLKNNSTNDSKIMVYDKQHRDISIGQTVTLRGKTGSFQKARNPGNFDQLRYYAQQNIYGVIWCEDILKIEGEENCFKESLYQLKIQCKANICQIMGDKNGAILSAMLLGDKNNIDADVKEVYQKNGIGHILAISGLHISFLGLGVYHMIRKTGLGYVGSGLLAGILLSIYILMIGYSVSAVRAFIMLLFRIGADVSGRVYDGLTALCVAATVTVGMQPQAFVDAGFLLSYGAILGIMFVLPAMERMFRVRWKIITGCYASMAVNIILFPIILFFYYEFSVYSIFTNLLVIPLMSVVIGLGMLGSIGSFFSWSIGKLFLNVCNVVLDLFELITRTSSKLPFSRAVVGQPDLWKLIFYYLVLFVLLVGVFHCKKRKGIRRMRWIFCGSFVLLIFLMAYKPRGDLSITMLDVGQGDSTFLRGPEGNTYLIDGGSSDVSQVAKYRLEPFLKSQGVGELDYVFVTHGDTDHYNGIAEMLERQDVGVKLKHLVFPCNWKQDEDLVSLAQLGQKQGVAVLVMQANERIQEGELQILCIQPTLQDGNLKGNGGSLVLEVHYREISLLCTGDVELEGEAILTQRIQGSFTILKVAHHGSKSSSTEKFLEVVRPKIALISAGEDNAYGHPHEETLMRLLDRGCKIFTTIKNGAITIETDGNSLTFH